MSDPKLYELCTEVFKKTTWQPIDCWNYIIADPMRLKFQHDESTIPKYTSDYLLEKLQESGATVLLRWNRDLGGRAGMKAWDGKYCAGTFDMPQGDYPVTDTPLKALLKLTLALHEAGELEHV